MIMSIIVLVTCVLMIAELNAIIKITDLSKEKTLKRPLWASLFPVIYLVLTNYRKNNDVSPIIEQLRSILKNDDKKFKEDDCFYILDNIINKADTMCNKEYDIIISSIEKYYSDLFKQLSEVLTENEKNICILHHLGVKPQIVGEIIHISYATVRTHKARIKLKLSEAEFDLFFSSNNS